MASLSWPWEPLEPEDSSPSESEPIDPIDTWDEERQPWERRWEEEYSSDDWEER